MNDLDEAKDCIDRIFGDKSVSKETTIENLQDLYNDLSIKIEALEVEINQELKNRQTMKGGV